MKTILAGFRQFMLYMLVVAPVRALSALADRVSLGELDAAAFAHGGADEIGALGEAFTRMRKSLVQALKMLDT